MRKDHAILMLAAFALVVGFVVKKWAWTTVDEVSPFQDMLSLADSLGELQPLPMDHCWEELIAADEEDEKEGYRSGLSYPGHRRPGSISITSSRWRPDTSRCGPRLRAALDKWRPIIERNSLIGERRREALRVLRTDMEARLNGIDAEVLRQLRLDIVGRAHLSQLEEDQLFCIEKNLK